MNINPCATKPKLYNFCATEYIKQWGRVPQVIYHILPWDRQSAVMEGLTSTSDRGLVKLEGPLQNCDPCGGAKTTVEERRLRPTKLVYSLYYSTDLNVGEWLCMTWKSCKAFTHLSEKSCTYFGHKRTPTTSSLNWQNRRTWVLFSHGKDGVGLVMCSVENLPAFLKLLSDGHQRVKGKEAVQKPPKEELQKQNFRL